MPIGPGIYDGQCTWARFYTEAAAIALIVIEGKHGSGCSVQGLPVVIQELPQMLRHMADEIEKQGIDT
jgi:hypothetical protein